MDKNLLKRAKKLMESATLVPDSYNCPKCRDRGYIFETRENNCDVAIPCQCLAKKQVFEKLEKCGLSSAFKKKTFANYVCEDQYQIKE